jgi:pimeloyl-ACP methyl ester carboxylesterase
VPADKDTTPFVLDSGTGSPVLFVHGQPGLGRDWQPVVEALQALGDQDHKPVRVLVPDRPGWGSSPEPATGIADNAAWLEQALAGLVGDEPVLVVGHSFGGGVAIRLALARPRRVRALVLVSSIGSGAALSRLDRALARPVMGEGIVRGGVFAARRLGRVVRRAVEGPERHAEIASRVENMPVLRALAGDEPITERAWRSFLVEQRALVDETRLLERSLATVSVPTVIIAGSKDHIVPAPATRALAAAIPGAELITVPRAGHLVPTESPDLVAAAIVRYLDLTAGRTGPG